MTAIAIDTNILVYAAGVERDPADREKGDRARNLLASLGKSPLVVPVQALAEFHFVLRRNGITREDARLEIEKVKSYSIAPPSVDSTFEAALILATEHRFQVFDALILSASAEAQARWLLSEDMQDGFRWRGVEIINPLAIPLRETLARIGQA